MSLNLKKHIKNKPFLLAPMDNVTDLGFRKLCEKNGASYSTTELISIESLIRDKVPKYRYEKSDLEINAIQIFGSNAQNFVKSIDIIENQADIIDVNFGCPSSSVTKNDAGSALLKDPKNVGKIISNLTSNTNLPITAKIRLGYKKTTYLDVAKEIEDAGASLITVHGRTAAQKYSGQANWDAIKEVYENLNIPVIGNGDIKIEEDIDKYINSHSTGLMIGRAAIGNPLIFKRFNHYYKTGKKLEFDKKKVQKELFKEYINNIEKIDFYQKNIKIQRQAMWFMKGIEGSKELREKLSKTTNTDEIYHYLDNF